MICTVSDEVKKPLSVCAGLRPELGGLYRSILDVAMAVDGPIGSFGRANVADDPMLSVRSVCMDRESLWSRICVPSRRVQRSVESWTTNTNAIVCHSLFRSHNEWVRRRAQEIGVPYICVPHGTLDRFVFATKQHVKRAWMAWFGHRFLRDAAAVVFATSFEQSRAMELLESRLPSSRVVPFPVESRSATPTEREKGEARLRLGLPLNKRILLFFGRFHTVKRPAETIQAFKDARVQGCMLALVGYDGDVSAADLRQVATELPCGDIVVRSGVSGVDRADWLVAADGFISLSRRENFGYSAAEALGAGCPVILTPGNGLSGDLKGVPCGWLLDDDARDSIVECIRLWARADPAELRTRGEAGRAVAARTFSRTAFAKSLGEMVLGAIKRQPDGRNRS